MTHPSLTTSPVHHRPSPSSSPLPSRHVCRRKRDSTHTHRRGQVRLGACSVLSDRRRLHDAGDRGELHACYLMHLYHLSFLKSRVHQPNLTVQIDVCCTTAVHRHGSVKTRLPSIHQSIHPRVRSVTSDSLQCLPPVVARISVYNPAQLSDRTSDPPDTATLTLPSLPLSHGPLLSPLSPVWYPAHPRDSGHRGRAAQEPLQVPLRPLQD